MSGSSIVTTSTGSCARGRGRRRCRRSSWIERRHRDDRRWRHAARQIRGANGVRRGGAVEAGQIDVHQDDVVRLRRGLRRPRARRSRRCRASSRSARGRSRRAARDPANRRRAGRAAADAWRPPRSRRRAAARSNGLPTRAAAIEQRSASRARPSASARVCSVRRSRITSCSRVGRRLDHPDPRPLPVGEIALRAGRSPRRRARSADSADRDAAHRAPPGSCRPPIDPKS